MQAEPQRPDDDQRGDQPLPGVRRCCPRPARARCRADQPDRKGPDGIDPAGIAGALLHHPGERHQDRQRKGNGDQRFKIRNRHTDTSHCPVDRWTLTKYALRTRPVSTWGSGLKCPVDRRIGLRRSQLLSRHRCAIVRPEQRFPRIRMSSNVLRLRLPLRDGDRTDQTVLAADLPGADAGVPGAVRAGHGRAVQADRRSPSSPIPASTR